MSGLIERKAKVVATLGPSSENREKVVRLVEAGVNVVRLNLSHGSLDTHERLIGVVREVSESLDTPVGILMDLQGPRIRTGRLPDGPMEVAPGETLTVVPEGDGPGVSATGKRITTTYPGFYEDVRPGDRVLIDDGLIELRVREVAESGVECEVVFGGPIGEHKGMNLPGVKVSAPALTEKDLAGVDLGLRAGVDYFALSFVRSAADVIRLKKLLGERGRETPVIAKIERAEAVDEIDEVLNASDGIMIARGDLGVELGAEKVPVLQKRLIAAANRADKLVITATQMLESMISKPRPTRAEASDVANAVFDGTDALMLSGETAVGAYPVKAVEIMVKVIREAELADGEKPYMRRRPGSPDSFARAVAFAASAASTEVSSKAIVVFTQTGDTAIMLSKLRPSAPVVAFTPLRETCRRLALVWGVTSFCIDFGEHTDEMICRGEAALLDRELAGWGDRVVIISGTRVGMRGATNMMKIDWIGSEECRVYLKGKGPVAAGEEEAT